MLYESDVFMICDIVGEYIGWAIFFIFIFDVFVVSLSLFSNILSTLYTRLSCHSGHLEVFPPLWQQ